MIIIKFYEVGDAYDAEGRGPYQVIGRFANEKDAKDYAKKRGNYNTDAKVTKQEFVVAESLDEHLQANKELPTWCDFVDCRQVGYNRKGKLLAYDYGRN